MKKKTVAALAAFICLVLLLSGCAAYKEHSKELSATVGIWYLDSVYINTKPVESGSVKMEIKEDYSGIYTEYFDNMDGTMSETTKSLKVTGGNGTLTMTVGDTSTTYEFNVDEASGDFHLIMTDANGDIYHYVYLSEEAWNEEKATVQNK